MGETAPPQRIAAFRPGWKNAGRLRDIFLRGIGEILKSIGIPVDGCRARRKTLALAVLPMFKRDLI